MILSRQYTALGIDRHTLSGIHPANDDFLVETRKVNTFVANLSFLYKLVIMFFINSLLIRKNYLRCCALQGFDHNFVQSNKISLFNLFRTQLKSLQG